MTIMHKIAKRPNFHSATHEWFRSISAQPVRESSIFHEKWTPSLSCMRECVCAKWLVFRKKSESKQRLTMQCKGAISFQTHCPGEVLHLNCLPRISPNSVSATIFILQSNVQRHIALMKRWSISPTIETINHSVRSFSLTSAIGSVRADRLFRWNAHNVSHKAWQFPAQGY